MRRRGQVFEATVGAVVLAALLAVIGLSYGRAAVVPELDGGYRIHATFNRVTGLQTGAPVYIAGIAIGTVTDQSLDERYRVRVQMKIQNGIKLPEDTSVAIETDGLFGDKYVSMLPGGSYDYLGAGDRIEYTQDAVVVEDLLDLIIAQGRAARAGKEGNGRPTGERS